jgi:hypothetical protein
MAFFITTPQIGFQPISQTSTTIGPHALGTVVKGVDPVYGEGEFIYLLGVASTVAGSLVTWNGNSSGTPTYQTTLAPSTVGLAQPVAVAMSANVATQYGWYQIGGNAVVNTNGTLAAGPGPIYLAGSGQVTSTQANGKQVLNAVNVTATGTPAANFAVIEIDRPFAQGQVV